MIKMMLVLSYYDNIYARNVWHNVSIQCYVEVHVRGYQRVGLTPNVLNTL